jgi:hypothetical protein
MDERILPLLCDPDTHDALELDTGALLNSKSGRRYPIIPIFFEALSGSNKKYQELITASPGSTIQPKRCTAPRPKRSLNMLTLHHMSRFN